eukprot:m.312355 g.312355  ORF g.312355 m.312355 type:complete len:64 (-) comp16402_c0_seq1:484-675(-)
MKRTVRTGWKPRYYYKNRERILAQRRAKREGQSVPPASEKVKASTLVYLYHNLKNYLESENLI